MRRIRTVLLIITIVSLLIGISAAFFASMGSTVAQDTGTHQRAPLNPDFLDYLDNPPDPFYGYIPPPVSLSHLSEVSVPRMAALTQLPGAFDWRDEGKVTPVRDQHPCGTCWIFGTISAIESRVLIVDDVEYDPSEHDFSEQNVACCTDPSWVDLAGDRCEAGGWSWLATDVLTKKGTRLESCDPYNTGTIDTESCDDDCTTIKRVTGYRMVANSPDQIDEVKNAIYNDGPVSMAYYNDPAYMYPGSIYYYPGCTEAANHLVSIVGWDDDIAHPADGGSGVWIVKNSWGTGWGDGGYFYLCYGSANMQEVASYRYQDYHPGERVYYWDEAGWVGNVGYSGSDSAWMANVFTCERSADLTHVDFWTTSNGAQYELYVYDGSLPDSLGSLRASKSGTCDELGYYSIPLDTQVPMTAAQQFTVAVKMTTPGYTYPLPVERRWELGGKVYADPPIQSGVCYARQSDSGLWADVASSGVNFCLRAILTNSPPSVASVAITPDPAYTNTDLTAVPSGWSDADGDPEGYQWQWQKRDGLDWQDISGATSDTLDSSNFAKDDKVKVICTPYDGLNTGDPVEGTITIQNSIPVLSDGAVVPFTGNGATAFTYTVIYTDADNDLPTSITVTVDGTPYAMGVQGGQDGDFTNGEIYEYITTGDVLGIGSHTFQFAANDGGEATGDTALHYGPGVDNSAPTLSDGMVNPADGTVTTAFTYTVTYTDVDDDGPMSVTVTIDGTPHDMSVQAGQDGDFTNGEIYEHTTTGLVKNIGHDFQFAASDGVDDAVGAAVPGPTVINSPPSVNSVAINPDPAYTDTDLTAVPSGWDDADGDPEGYQWQWQKWDGLDWQDIVGETSDILDSSNFVKDDRVNVTCTAYDGSDTGTQKDDEVTISNAPPTADAGPAQGKYVNNLVTLDGSGSSDPDDDLLTYDWTQTEGSPVTISDSTAVDPTFTPTVADTYTFSLVVNDGELDSAPGTVLITVTRPAGGGGGGGGGGGAPPKPKVKMDILDTLTSVSMTEEGMLEEALEVTSSDGTVSLCFPEGTLMLDSEGNPLKKITVDPVSDLPEPPAKAHIIGVACDFEPDGAIFEPPIELIVTYDPEALPEGVNEEDLVIALYDAESGEWVLLPSQVDPDTHTITASVSHFTVFGVIGREEAAFDFANLSISPNMVDSEESVIMTIDVTNVGGLGGSCTITLLIDGAEEATQKLTLAPGASDTVTFTVTREDAGTYSVEIDKLTGEFTVRAHTFPWALVGSVIGGVLGLLAVAAITVYLVFFRRRRAAA